MTENFLDRLKKEEAELTEKCTKLSDFIDSKNFPMLPEIEQVDLREQLDHMLNYRNVLLRRLNRNTQ